MKKRPVSLALVLILAVTVGVSALAVVEQSDDFYVADYANVLSDLTKSDIISANVDMEAQCSGAQIVVVTVKSLEGMYSDEYAMTLFNSWGVGNAEENNGMLLLVAPSENRAWLTVGIGIQGAFPTSMVDDYFDSYFWVLFDAGDNDAAVRNMLEPLFS